MADANYEIDLELIKRRAVSGIVTFTVRTIFLQVFTFFSTFLLTVLLEPSVFGVFFVVSALINLFVYFSDVGLAAALIQKKDEPTRTDLTTTFTIQQLIIFSLVFLGLFFSNRIAAFYELDAAGLMLLRVLILSLVFSSLKTIPSIILERRLDFTRLVIPQIIENVVFYSLAVFLASRGFGITSFTYAVLARGIIGLSIIYILSPWLPGVGLSTQSTKKLVSFGIPFQLNSILALLKDDLLTVFLGKVLSFTQVGYVGWAQKWAFVPLRFFMDNVNKVAFPAYSRLQDHKGELSKAIEKSLFFVTYFVFPASAGIAAIAPRFVELIPRYQKWEPALPLLYLFAANSIFSAISTTLTNALFAIGKPKIVLNLMIFWTTLTWVLTYILILKFGYIGVGLASLIVAATSLSTVYFAKKEVDFKIGSNIFGPFLVSVIMFIIISSFIRFTTPGLIGLAFAVIFGAIIYFIISFSVLKRTLTQDAMTIINTLIFKRSQ